MDSHSPHDTTLCYGLGYQDSVEEIGHMAGALSYQHVFPSTCHLSLVLQANSLDGVIQFYEDLICATYDK